MLEKSLQGMKGETVKPKGIPELIFMDSEAIQSTKIRERKTNLN